MRQVFVGRGGGLALGHFLRGGLSGLDGGDCLFALLARDGGLQESVLGALGGFGLLGGDVGFVGTGSELLLAGAGTQVAAAHFHNFILAFGKAGLLAVSRLGSLRLDLRGQNGSINIVADHVLLSGVSVGDDRVLVFGLVAKSLGRMHIAGSFFLSHGSHS